MSEYERREPTNRELHVALGKIAIDSIQRSRAQTCFDAQERIYELTEAVKALTYGLPELLDNLGYTDEEGLVAKSQALLAKATGSADPAAA